MGNPTREGTRVPVTGVFVQDHRVEKHFQRHCWLSENNLKTPCTSIIMITIIITIIVPAKALCVPQATCHSNSFNRHVSSTGWCRYSPHVTDEQTEAQRGYVNGLRSHSWDPPPTRPPPAVKPRQFGFEPRFSPRFTMSRCPNLRSLHQKYSPSLWVLRERPACLRVPRTPTAVEISIFSWLVYRLGVRAE